MKPRTKLHHLVVELSKKLPRITESQKQWAYKECLPHKGYANRSSAFCLDCGETFSLELIKRKRATCPHCNTNLEIEVTKKRTSEFTNYFAITHVVDGNQVVENFELIAKYKKGKPVNHFLHAILEDWIMPTGKVQKIGLRHINNWGADCWSGDWEIREGGQSYWNRDKYDVYARKYHPDSVFKREYSKYGINQNLSGFSMLEAIEHLPNYPRFETLLKAKYNIFLNLDYRHRIDMFWPSFKIVIRNKYKINDSSIYLDYLDLLHYFKKDLHNAKYVCPKNLKKAHDILMRKKQEIQQREEQERAERNLTRKQQKLEKAIVEYVERTRKFFELEITSGNISITVLKSVDEFKDEGDELKHCVYTNEYYLKESSLILSAKVDGKRTETIELKLPKLNIKQSRGINNDPSPHNEKIVAVVKKNLSKIRTILKQSA